MAAGIACSGAGGLKKVKVLELAQGANRMGKKLEVRNAAALHLATGALTKASAEVPVGRHELGGLSVHLVFPEGAAVERGEGSLGEGYDAYTPPTKGLTLAAVWLFLRRAGVQGPKLVALWVECLREAQELRLKDDDNMPVEVLEALAQVQVRVQDECTHRRKTAARRIGAELVQIEIAEGKKRRR